MYGTLIVTVPNLNFEEWLPKASLFDPTTKNLMVMDDLMAKKDGRVATLFTKNSHHADTSVVYLVQSLLPKQYEIAIHGAVQESA